MLISVEGNIGSGKSTIVESMKQMYGNSREFIFIQEPVDVWKTIKDKEGHDIIEKFYGDQKKYGFSFQMMAYITRLSLLKSTIRDNPGKHIIMERSMYTDKNVFAKMLHVDGKIEDVEYQIYTRWFNEFLEDAHIDKTIYIRASPFVCCSRIQKRNRDGEAGISVDYLTNCSYYHDDWIMKMNPLQRLIIDVNTDINENPAAMDKWLRQISRFIDN